MATQTIHPDMQPLLDAREQADALVGPQGETPEDARRWWRVYASILPQPRPADMRVFDATIPAGHGGVPVRVYQPAGRSGARPCVLYMHGGGFMLGDLDTSDGNAWGYAQETGATVVSIDYRLTPEHPYPAAFDDCYGVLTWLAANPDEVGIDAGRIAVVGDSAGGMLGAALALASRDRGGPPIAAQALLYGWFGLEQDAGSYVEFADGPGLTSASMHRFDRLYLPDDPDSADPYARPVRALDFTNLPPALVHAAGIDPIRDDSRFFAARLALAGTPVTYREARGMIHGFLRARSAGPGAHAEFTVACAFLREHLGS